MSKRPIIAIDGPSGSGKSSLAKALSKDLQYYPIDSGAMYRALAVWAKERPLEEVLECLTHFSYTETYENGQKRYFVNGEDVTAVIRTETISKNASIISKNQQVRELVNELQQKVATSCNASFRGVVVEGRDATTVVFPKAKYKIFLTADLQERAKRRQGDVGPSHTQEEVHREMKMRDERDLTRAHSPLQQAMDAKVVDTTHLTPEQTLKIVKEYVRGEKVHKPTWLYRFVRRFFSIFMKGLYRFRVEGLENVPPGGAIIAANHSSFLDPPAVAVATPGQLSAIAADWLFRLPVVGFVLRRLEVISTPRAGTFSHESLRQIVDYLEEQKNLLIFPEGQRSRTGNLLEFKRGMALLAAKVNHPVVPTYVQGAYKIWPPGKKVPHIRGQITVHFASPLWWSDYIDRYPSDKEAQLALTQDVRDAILRLQDLCNERHDTV